ncbi:TPA: hypothetical protein OMU21_004962 [Klebsiella aerogenes]|nr:hypothetical protein [Klebsiella aerogenes]
MNAITMDTEKTTVKALLQRMTDRCLTGSAEFREALKVFGVTTTYSFYTEAHFEELEPEGTAHYFVDVFAPDTIDAEPHGRRYGFAKASDAVRFELEHRNA